MALGMTGIALFMLLMELQKVGHLAIGYAVRYPAVLVFNHKIYLFGGKNSINQAVNWWQFYYSATNTPTINPTWTPTMIPSENPTQVTSLPSFSPITSTSTSSPTRNPSANPSWNPSKKSIKWTDTISNHWSDIYSIGCLCIYIHKQSTL
eukprot:275852_1